MCPQYTCICKSGGMGGARTLCRKAITSSISFLYLSDLSLVLVFKVFAQLKFPTFHEFSKDEISESEYSHYSIGLGLLRPPSFQTLVI